MDSEDLDPSEALFGEGNVCVKIPVPDAKIFNNLAEYYSKTFAKKNEKRTEENITKQLSAIASTSSSRFENFQTKSNEETRKGHRPSRPSTISVIDKMQQCYGPLSLLYQSVSKSIRVLVRRRKTCSLKEERFAWITGHLVAFDKHLNLALQNVSEEYMHKQVGSDRPIRIKKCTKQLLVRGDNIVLVSHLNSFH